MGLRVEAYLLAYTLLSKQMAHYHRACLWIHPIYGVSRWHAEALRDSYIEAALLRRTAAARSEITSTTTLHARRRSTTLQARPWMAFTHRGAITETTVVAREAW